MKKYLIILSIFFIMKPLMLSAVTPCLDDVTTLDLVQEHEKRISSTYAGPSRECLSEKKHTEVMLELRKRLMNSNENQFHLQSGTYRRVYTQYKGFNETLDVNAEIVDNELINVNGNPCQTRYCLSSRGPSSILIESPTRFYFLLHGVAAIYEWQSP